MFRRSPRAARRILQPTPSVLPPSGRTPDAPLAVPAPRLALAVAGRVLTPSDAQVVGADDSCDVVLKHPHVSARHVVFQPADPTSVLVKDLGSTNGTWCRGERLEAGTPRRVEAGECVMLGRVPILIGQALRRYPAAMVWQEMVARDPLSLEVLGVLGQVAAFDAPVWVQGESGTGKEGACRALHAASRRRNGPFVALNCAALPETLAEAELFGSERGAFTGALKRAGAFVRADGGTLLLDEVGELPAAVQAKLLRVLESGEVRPVGGSASRRVDVRVVGSTWRDLNADAASGRFRFDLLQRLSVLAVALPPLRERTGDIPALVEHLLSSMGGAALRPDPDTMGWLMSQPWRGNIRELRNTIRRVVVAGGWSEGLSPVASQPRQGALMTRLHQGTTTVSSGQRHSLARLAVRKCSGNRARAARSLGVSRSTLYRWLARSG